MAGLSHLRDVYDKRGKDFLEGLLNKTVIVNEKMDGAFFGAQKNPETNKFKYFKRNAEITHIDRVLSKYYEPAIKHFEGLKSDVVSQIPNNYHFGMEWFTSPKAQTIAYDRLPKNGLILSYIHILDESGQISETVQDKETLDKWAGILNIEPPPIVFQGKLTDFQKEKVQEFIYTPFSELVDRFKTTSFTKYIISVLNPEMGASFLRDTLDQDIEGLVFRFYDPKNKSEDSVFLAKLVDPVFQANAKQKAQDRVQKKSDDYIWIIVIDLMNFIERHSVSELRSIKLSGKSYEERYISLVNHIYLNFISEFGEKYTDLDIQIPEFLQREEFGVNFKMINNNKVTKILESNHNFKEIYRIFLNIFRKKSVRVSSTFFTKEMRANLVSQINKLSNVILGDSVFENYFPTFGEFVGEDKDPGYFESYAEIPEEKKKAKRVNVIISDFQPIHPGHIKSAQKLFDTNGLPCLFACIHSGSTNKSKPFKKETVSNILAKLVNQHPSFITGWVMVSDNEVENLLREIKPAYDPVIVAASKNRIKDIALQLELARKRSRNLNFKKDLKLIELPPAGLKDSIMKHIKNQDYLNFKVDAPNEIHSEFFNMNRDMNESVNESVEASFANEVPQPDEPADMAKQLLDLKDSDPKVYNRIKKMLNGTDKAAINKLTDKLKEKGYTNLVRPIVVTIDDLDLTDEVLAYLENPTITFEDITNEPNGNLKTLFNTTALSPELYNSLFNIIGSKGRINIGKGEVLLSILVKDAKQAPKSSNDDDKGDIKIENKFTVEIKASKEKGADGSPVYFRLTGQGENGSGQDAGDHIRTELIKLFKSKGHEPPEYISSEKSFTPSYSLNPNKKGLYFSEGISLAVNLLDLSSSSGSSGTSGINGSSETSGNKAEVVNILANGFHKIYKNTDKSELTNIFNLAIEADGKFNTQTYLKGMLRLEFDKYLTDGTYTYFMAIDEETGRYVLINGKIKEDQLKYFKVGAANNLRTSATDSDSVLGVAINMAIFQ